MKKIWGDPVWSKVIASAIVGAFGLAVAYFAGWWPWVAAACQWVGNFLIASTPLPNWLVGILGLCTLLITAFLVVLLWAALTHVEKRPKSKILDYREDRILGLLWRWGYESNGAIIHLASFCPRCDLQVMPRNASAYRVIERIEYWCDDCRCSLNTFDMSLNEVESLVRRKIQQQVRTLATAETAAF